MRKDLTDGTVYDEFEVWSQSQGLAADAALEMIVDAFYERNLEDERLARFFDGVDLKSLKKHQFNFMRYVFTRISDFAVVPYPPDQSSRPEFAGLRREKPHHGG